MNQGDIILVKYPFSNLIDYKIRPALVVSSTEFNKAYDAWVCPLTSKERENTIPIDEAITEGTLQKESYVKTTTLSSIHEDLILRKIGSITKQKTLEVIQQLKKNFN